MVVTRILTALGDAVGAVIAFIPALLGFLLVLGIGYLIAKALQKLTGAILARVGFNRLVERGGVKRWMARTSWEPSDLIARGVFWVAMIFVLQLSFGVFGPNPVSAILTGLIAYLPNVFAAAFIVIVAAAVAAVVRDMVDAAMASVSYGKTIATGTAVAIMVVAAFAALSQLRIAPAIVNGLFFAILAAVVGIAVVAIGGAGITPMREYWTRTLHRVEAEAPTVRQSARQAPERVKERAEQRAEQVRTAVEEPERQPVGAGTGMGMGGDTRRP